MSADANAQDAPPKKAPYSVFSSTKSRSNRGNSSTPPELKRNEAAARAKRTQQISEKHGMTEETVQNAEQELDPCRKKDVTPVEVVQKFKNTPGLDPRFQQQNQTLRCYVMYMDFFRCEKILGEGHEACPWFRDVYTSICPNAWIEKWDQFRSEGRMPFTHYKTQGNFPGDRYGV